MLNWNLVFLFDLLPTRTHTFTKRTREEIKTNEIKWPDGSDFGRRYKDLMTFADRIVANSSEWVTHTMIFRWLSCGAVDQSEENNKAHYKAKQTHLLKILTGVCMCVYVCACVNYCRLCLLFIKYHHSEIVFDLFLFFFSVSSSSSSISVFIAFFVNIIEE